MNLPALTTLNKLNPNAQFTMVGNVASLELAQEFVPVENVFSIESPPWSRLFYEALLDLDFDSAIVWMKDSTVAENLRLSGITNVHRADAFPAFGHAADHLLRTLKLERPELPDVWMPDSGEVIVHAGSGGSKKIWPYFTELIERVQSARLLLPPSPSGRGQREGHSLDELLLSPALQAASPRGRGIRSLENLSLIEVSRHLRKCAAYIGNDSGITHLAAYLGCPTIALFGPTDPRVWGPLGRRARVLWKSKLEDITVDEVLLALHAAHARTRIDG